jgi:hypothetical protein
MTGHEYNAVWSTDLRIFPDSLKHIHATGCWENKVDKYELRGKLS